MGDGKQQQAISEPSDIYAVHQMHHDNNIMIHYTLLYYKCVVYILYAVHDNSRIPLKCIDMCVCSFMCVCVCVHMI